MNRIVQMSTLGNNGRFGNQLFQFCFIKAYAEKYNAKLEIPENWIGRNLFKDIDKIDSISCKLPKTKLDEIPKGKVNIDFFGYYQFEHAFDLYTYENIEKWLQFKDSIVNLLTPKNTNYIACHLRRGDYATKYSHIYCTISKRSYEKAILNNGYCLSDNVVWLSEEFPQKIDNCPYSFLPDFFILMNAKALFRSNSTFSVWASLLGRKDMITYAPIVEGITGIDKDVNFQWGNWHRVVSDYKGASSQIPAEFIWRR